MCVHTCTHAHVHLYINVNAHTCTRTFIYKISLLLLESWRYRDEVVIFPALLGRYLIREMKHTCRYVRAQAENKLLRRIEAK